LTRRGRIRDENVLGRSVWERRRRRQRFIGKSAREKHVPPVAVQTQHAQAARTNPEQRASVNQGKPPVAATPKPGAFTDRAVVPAKAAGAPYTPPVNRAAVQPTANIPAAHPESNAVRPERVAPDNKPETNRPPTGQPNNRPEPNRAEPSPPESSHPPAAHPNSSPELKRNEPADRSQAPPPSERPQAQRVAPDEKGRTAQEQQHTKPAPPKPEEKKSQAAPPQRDEKPPQ
jgi:hypothetical protein